MSNNLRWTQAQYDDYQRRHAAAKRQVDSVLSSSKSEQVVRHDALGSKPGKEKSICRRKIVIVSFRKRLIDPYNLCPKYFIDALRYRGVIDDDTAKHIVLEVRQEKVKYASMERTEIDVIPITG
mgnify:CR=1 FL=1